MELKKVDVGLTPTSLFLENWIAKRNEKLHTETAWKHGSFGRSDIFLASAPRSMELKKEGSLRMF